MAALDIFIVVQGFLTIILFVVALYFWQALRKRSDISALKSTRLYTILFLFALPFIISILAFIPEDISILLRHILFFFLFFVAFVVTFRTYKAYTTLRKQDLRDLYEQAEKHPIRLAFARSIVVPELQKLTQKQNEITKLHHTITLQEKTVKRRERAVEARQKAIIQAKQTLATEWEKLQREAITIRAHKRDSQRYILDARAKRTHADKLIQALKEREHDLQKKQERIAQTDARLATTYKASRDTLAKRYKEELAAIKKEMHEKVSQRLAELAKKEKHLDSLDQELSLLKRNLKAKEQETAAYEAQKRAAEQQTERLKEEQKQLKKAEEAYRKERETLEEARKTLKQESKDFERERAAILAERAHFKRKDARILTIDKALREEKERLAAKHAELDTLLRETREKERELARQASALAHERAKLAAEKKERGNGTGSQKDSKKKPGNGTQSLADEVKEKVERLFGMFGW